MCPKQKIPRKRAVYLPRFSQSSFFSKSRTADLMTELLLGYMLALTSSSKPSRYASGNRTVTSFISVFSLNYVMLITCDKYKI